MNALFLLYGYKTNYIFHLMYGIYVCASKNVTLLGKYMQPRLTRRVSLVEQELPTLPEHPMVLVGLRIWYPLQFKNYTYIIVTYV